LWRLSIQNDQRNSFLRNYGWLRRITYGGLNIVLAGIALLGILYGSAYAAVELSAYNVFVLPTGVVLEWQTASEYDLIGFEVWYKEESASQSAYILLGKRIAQGGPRRGVTYHLDVTSFLKADTTYCFQLRELPVNGERGEILIRCGYGLGISAQPTPTPTPFFPPTTPFTPTNGLTTTTPLTGTPGITDPFAQFTSTPDPFALPTPTLDPFAPPVPGTGPGVTNTFPIPPTDPNQGSVVFPTFTPTPFGQSFLPTPTPPFVTTTVTTTAGALNSPVDPLAQTTLPTDGAAGGGPSPVTLPLTATNPVQVAANPPYIVLTATPTTPAATPAPTFTAYPTVARVAEGDTVLGLAMPDTQNLMIMLLCGVFSGASGLGILGLVSTLLYMRSRNAAQQSRSNQRHI
jgi:hypothetical protein